MKVVLFCGGQGLRMREFADRIPKPLAPLAERPILWHVMKYYAEQGHRDFVLCLGYGGQQIKDYFINYKEWDSNDFTMTGVPNQIELHGSDLDDWTITFVDTGIHSPLGERLRRVRHHLEGEQTFLCNYADGLTDCDLDNIIDLHRRTDATVTIMAARPTRSLHVLDIRADSTVSSIGPLGESELWINAGYMVMEQGIFDVLEPGEELVEEPFERLIRAGKLSAYRHEGHSVGVDTFKERQEMEDLWVQGNAWWAIWKKDWER